MPELDGNTAGNPSIELPDGVHREDVDIINSAFGKVTADTPSNQDTVPKPFNPQNGRYYTGGLFDTDRIRMNFVMAGGSREVHCAYEDCDGITQLEYYFQIPTEETCDRCQAPAMGRGQFHEYLTDFRPVKLPSGTREELSLKSDEKQTGLKSRLVSEVGPTATLDYITCVVQDEPVSSWASNRGVTENTVRENIKKARDSM